MRWTSQEADPGLALRVEPLVCRRYSGLGGVGKVARALCDVEQAAKSKSRRVRHTAGRLSEREVRDFLNRARDCVHPIAGLGNDDQMFALR